MVARSHPARTVSASIYVCIYIYMYNLINNIRERVQWRVYVSVKLVQSRDSRGRRQEYKLALRVLSARTGLSVRCSSIFRRWPLYIAQPCVYANAIFPDQIACYRNSETYPSPGKCRPLVCTGGWIASVETVRH